MINPHSFIGEPLNFHDKLKVYPPRVKDVVTNPNFGIFLKILTITTEDLRDELKLENDISPFEFLLANCYQSDQMRQLTIQAFEFFCHTKIGFIFEDKQIIIGDPEELVKNIQSVDEIKFLLEEEYFDFQNMIRVAIGDKPVKPPEPVDPNEDPRIRRIKEKARERDRIKARQSGKNGISLETCLVAICCMGLGITPLNIGEMSYASVGEIMKMMQDKEKYDIDIRSLLAGADSKKVKPKYWIRNND